MTAKRPKGRSPAVRRPPAITALLFLSFWGLALGSPLRAEAPAHPMDMAHDKPFYLMTSEDCGAMEYWDPASGMAKPFPMARMPESMLMFHGGGFLVLSAEEGLARGREGVYSPNMLMADLGTTLGDTYLNLDVMLTAELWTIPRDGYPELYQIGERKADGTPFLDAQHPHSSPLMGLTLSDTIALDEGDKSCLELFAAPRGETTDGPVPFMHRATGLFNPDAPLGHHIGQDVGHVTSSVLGGSLKLGGIHLEASLFHGMEPSPDQVDLPLGSLDSWACRFIGEVSPRLMAMASYAYVGEPEPGVGHADRISASLYSQIDLGGPWVLKNSLVYGRVTHVDGADALDSFLDEVLLADDRTHVFARLETLQRTPSQLALPGLPEPDRGRWVTALSLGYSRKLFSLDGWEMDCGAMVTNDQSPSEYGVVYEGNPLSYKFFFQILGMGMTVL